MLLSWKDKVFISSDKVCGFSFINEYWKFDLLYEVILWTFPPLYLVSWLWKDELNCASTGERFNLLATNGIAVPKKQNKIIKLPT